MIIKAAILHARISALYTGPVLSSIEAVTDYLVTAMGCKPREEVRVLFLNTQHHLIRDEVVSQGSVTHATVYPREIIKRALDLGATALIIAHNHPSGDPAPSQEDIDLTKALVVAGRALEIRILDHFVIGSGSWVSFREKGML